jgi:replicative DNA helicase
MESNSEKAKLDRKRGPRTKNLSEGMEIGKIPPQALDLEEAVLGAVMLEKEAVATVSEILQPNYFYKEAHQKIYEAIKDLFGRTEPVDILSVTNELRKNGNLEIVGGAYYVAWLTSRVGSAANVEYHSRVIAEKFIKRELIRVSGEILQDSFDETVDTFDLMDTAEKKVFEIAENNIRKGFDSIQMLLEKAVKEMERMKEEKTQGVTGVESGFFELDRVTSGWQPTDLIILAARPSMGKTALSLCLLRNAAVQHRRPAAIFSLEMSSLQLVNRLIALETGINSEKIKKGKLEEVEWKILHEKIAHLAEAKIFIDDTAALSIFEFRAKARKLRAMHNIELIIVDYLQLMTAGSEGRGTREQEISAISRSLKGIAKELQIPIIALSQLSRASEGRSGFDKRPQLSDLRESGSIEQDADMVMFIFRPEYYEIPEDDEGNSTQGIAEIIIKKHRNGALANIKLHFRQELARFENLGVPQHGASVSHYKGEADDQPDMYSLPSKMNDEDATTPF